MTSSSSLYGNVNQQNTQSTNSTSLYGGADTPIPTPEGDLVVRGDLIVLSGNILTTATTGNIFPANATTVNLGASATAVNIGADTGTTTINNNLVVDGDITAEGADFGNITIGVTDNNTIATTTGGLKLAPTDTNVGLIGTTTLYTDNTGTFNLLNSPTTIYAFDEATTLEIGASSGAGTTVVRNSFAVDGTQIGLAQGTIIAYSEANNRLNRPVVRSTTGNTSGFRVEAPNATTSASAVLSAFNTNDTDNGSFININARGNLTTPLRIQTGKYTAGVLGPSGTSLTFVDNITAYASLNPNGPTNPLDLTTKAYVDASTAAGVTSITGTADQVIASSSTGAVTLSLPQSIATTSNVTFADITATDDLTVQGNNVNLAPATLIGYSENNDRANRPVVRSTTGNSSGLRVEAPNATTSATSNVSAFSSNDGDNGKFINISARGAATTDLRIGTGKYTAGVLGPSGTVVSFVDNITTYATVNPSGPTNPLDLTTKAYVDALPANITYTIDSSATTGGANLNLVGSDATTDTIKFAGGTNVTVVATDANTITINAPDTNTTYTQNFSSTTGGTNLNLVGSDATTDTVKFADGTGVTVSYTDANTATVAIGQAVGTSDNVQFNGVTTNSLTTGTVNANGGVSFVNTAPMGGTYATVNQFGPFNGTDLTTVDYVNSVLPTVVTYTQDASATTGGANLNLVGSDATTDTVKFSGSGATTVSQTSANEITISSTDTNTTYTIDASATTGGANLNLVGSDATTDTVKFANGAGITVTQTDANTIAVASTITQYTDADARASISATGDISYNPTTGVISYTAPAAPVTSVNGQTGAVSLGLADLDDATITSATNKDFLQYNTTSSKWENGPIRDASRLAGSLEATQDPNYVFPPPTITAVSSNNGFDIASTSALYAGPNGAGPQASVTNYTNDTWAGANASAQFNLKGANGYSALSGVDPLTGVTMTGPTAANTTMALGAINFAGYATTGFANDICATNQSGGLSTLNTLQIQGVPRETFADAITTITPTAVSRSAPSITGVTITGTKGQFSCTSTTLGVGQAVRFVGTWTGTGSISGYTGDNTYYIVKTNNTTTFTLSATMNGAPIDTTAGTTTGAAVTRNVVTFTIPAQTTAPYNSGAKVTVSGITGLADGVYIATSTTTTTTVGAVTTAVSLGATPLLSIRNVTNGGATFRVRGFNSATNMTIANRTNFISHDLGTATYKSDQYNFQGGTNTFNYLTANASAVTAQGSFAVKDLTGATTYATVDVAKAAFTVPVGFPVKTAAQWRAITGAVGYQVCVSDSAAGSNPNGMMAFWDTTHARWSYIHDNTAV